MRSRSTRGPFLGAQESAPADGLRDVHNTVPGMPAAWLVELEFDSAGRFR